MTALLSIVGKRVLLAEDDTSSRAAIAKALRAMQLDVVETADGGRMLVAIASYYKNGRSPSDLDLVITDVRMPVVSGIEIFRGLRNAHWTLPVIVMTAFATDEVHETTTRYGAVLLIKPIVLDELEAAVTRLLSQPPAPARARR